MMKYHFWYIVAYNLFNGGEFEVIDCGWQRSNAEYKYIVALLRCTNKRATLGGQRKGFQTGNDKQISQTTLRTTVRFGHSLPFAGLICDGEPIASDPPDSTVCFRFPMKAHLL